MKAEIEIQRDELERPSVVIIKRGPQRLQAEVKATDKTGRASKIVLSARRNIMPSLAELLAIIYSSQSTIQIRGLNWHDRNPKTKADDYNDTLDPHTLTSRLSYVCAAGKIAMVEFLEAYIKRAVAPTTSGFADSRWMFTPNEGTTALLLYAGMDNAAVDASSEHAIGSTLILLEGDKLEGFTVDSSTDGKHIFLLSYKLTEFDA